jgi:hypothetical protein
MRRLATMLVLAAIVSAGCDTNVDAGPADGDTTDASSRCESVSRKLLHAITTGLTVSGGGSLSEAAAVRSSDFEKVWFVAAEIDGPGLEGSGDVGIWATNGDPSRRPSGLIFAVDAIAKEFSDWGDGSTADAQLSISDDGAQEAADCL